MMNEHKEFLLDLAAKAREELATQPEQWWYLSFANGDGFQGGYVVKAHGVLTARLAVKSAPKGEMLAFVVPAEKLPHAAFRGRFLSKEEVALAFDGAVNLATGEEIALEVL